MKGYTVDSGYMGYIPSEGKYRLFDTEEEYKVIYRIKEEGDDEESEET